MTLSPAPYFAEVSHGPEDGAAHWAKTSDGVRIRIGHWPLETQQGTVLIFPGRTEYIEKYGQIAGTLRTRGFASLAIDWRGQGLAERLLDHPLIGHVARFGDYQNDVATLVKAAEELQMPRPYRAFRST